MPGRVGGVGAQDPKSDVQGCWDLEVDLYTEVQCIMGSGHMGPAPYGQNERQTLPSRNFIGWW